MEAPRHLAFAIAVRGPLAGFDERIRKSATPPDLERIFARPGQGLRDDPVTGVEEQDGSPGLPVPISRSAG